MNTPVLKLLPVKLGRLLDADMREGAEEIRLRINRPVQVVYADGDRLIGGCILTSDDMRQILMTLCDDSLYAHEEELRSGFLTYCGCRIGLSGHAVTGGGKTMRLDDIGGINIRIAHEHKGCAKGVLRYLVDEQHRPKSTIIMSPPRVGKTTLLRDIARCFSNGLGVNPKKVCIIDERLEIAACSEGAPTFEIGVRTDVLYGISRAEGLMMAIRSLSPELLITDELGSCGDVQAIKTAGSAGVAVIASCHGDGRTMRSRRDIMGLLESGGIRGVLLIGRNESGIFVEEYLGEDAVNL